jgi:hypothetical protein
LLLLKALRSASTLSCAAGRFAVSSARRLVVFFLSPNKKEKETAFGLKVRWLMVPTVGLHVKSCGRPFCRDLCSQQFRIVEKFEKRYQLKLERIRELETTFEILKPDLTRNNNSIHQELENTSTISNNFEPKNKQPQTCSSDFSQFCQLKLFETNSTFTNQLKPDYFWSNFIHLSNETGNPELLTRLTCFKPFSITRRLVLNPNIIFKQVLTRNFQRNKNFKHIQPFRHFSNWFELNLNLNLFVFFLRTAQPHVLFQSYFVDFPKHFSDF